MHGSGRMAHAFLFVGPARVGKTTVALTLLNAVMGEGSVETHPDAVFVRRETDEKTGKEKSAISVEQVREACERFSLTSLSGRKAMFIEEADRMNAAAANALLKTLEEPKGNALIMLRAPSADDVPATIASRCQVVRFHAVPEPAIAEALVRRGLDHEEAAHLAARSHGAPGVAIRLLTDGEYRAQEDVASAAVRDLMAAPIARRLRAAAELMPKDEANKALVALCTLDAWERALRERMLGSVRDAPAALRLTRSLRRLAEARSGILHNASPQLALEHLLISL